VRTNDLLQAWQNDQATLGLWMSSPDPVAAEQMGDLDFDYVCADLQHGILDYTDAVRLMMGLSRSAAMPICRVPWNEPGIIGKLLDAGAMGIIVPMVNTVEQAKAAVSACRFWPEGSRSHGPLRAKQIYGDDYVANANSQIACIPMIETVEAISNLDDILDVPGINAVYIGPADLSLTYGLPPRPDNDDERFQSALQAVVEGCNKRGIAPGIHTTPELAQTRLDQGFKMVTITSNLSAMAVGAGQALEKLRQPSGTSEASMY